MSLATFHDEHGTFFHAKFYSYVLTVYSNGVYESFQFFCCVVLSKSMCISILGPSSSTCIWLLILFIHSAFSLCFFGCHIFVQNISVSFASGCWYVFVSLPPNCWYNFFSLFLSISFYPLSISLWSSFFRQHFLVYSLELYCYIFLLLVPFFPGLFQRLLFLSFWLVFQGFFYLHFQSNFPSRFRLLLRAFWGDPNFLQKLILHLYRLVHLTRLYY